MELIAQEVRSQITRLGEIADQADPMVWIKLTIPGTG